MSDFTVDRSKLIAALNDKFRRSGFGLMITPGVKAIDDLIGLLGEVKAFHAFTEDNDPYGEHDFGTILWKGEKVFWKLDYYDQDMKYGEDALSPKCRRVLTVMLAEEY